MHTQQIPFPLIDQISPPPQAIKHQRRAVAHTLGQVRQLHEELNDLLYSPSHGTAQHQ